MRILTHQGPGYRSTMLEKPQAADLARRLREDPHFTGVQVMESQRTRSAARFWVVCQPTLPEKRQELLDQFHQDRLARAAEEGPRFLWVGGQPPHVWHVLTLSGSTYRVDPEARTCTCRDYGVAADNGLVCKHLHAFDQGLGQFLTGADFQRLLHLAPQLTATAADPVPREPVAVPVAVGAAA